MARSSKNETVCKNMNVHVSSGVESQSEQTSESQGQKNKTGDEEQAVEALLQIKSVDLRVNNNKPVETSNCAGELHSERDGIPIEVTEEHKGTLNSSLKQTAMNSSSLVFHTSKYQDFDAGSVSRSMTSDVDIDLSDAKNSRRLGRHVCHYCGHRCAKPSVLTKHLRSHTGERPYPCLPCGFAFKTKSNLYKHCKSHAHAIKVGIKGTDSPSKGSNGEEDSEETESDDETKHFLGDGYVNKSNPLQQSLEIKSSEMNENYHVSPSPQQKVVSDPSQVSSQTRELKGSVLTEHSISKLLKQKGLAVAEESSSLSDDSQPQMKTLVADDSSPENTGELQIDLDSRRTLTGSHIHPLQGSGGAPTDASKEDSSDQILIPLSNFNIIKAKGQYHLQVPVGNLPPEALASIQSRAKEPTEEVVGKNKIKERIQKLISDNEEIMDNTNLESVKPRKSNFLLRDGESSLEEQSPVRVEVTSQSEKLDAVKSKNSMEEGDQTGLHHHMFPDSQDYHVRQMATSQSLSSARSHASVPEISLTHRNPHTPTPFSFSTGLAFATEGMPLKRKTKSESGGTEEGEVLFFSKKMKKTLVMPVDGNSSKGQDEGPSHPAILSNLLNAPKTFQTTPAHNMLLLPSPSHRSGTPHGMPGPPETTLGAISPRNIPVGRHSLPMKPVASTGVPVIQHARKIEPEGFSFTSGPSKQKYQPNPQGLLQIGEQPDVDAHASLTRPSSLNLGGVQKFNSSYISKKDRRLSISNRLVPTPKAGISPKGASSPRGTGNLPGMTSDVPTIQLGSPRTRTGLPTPDMTWKKLGEKSSYQSLNVDIASPLAKMVKFPPGGIGGKPIIDPRVLLSPEALSIAESVMKKASPTNAKTPSTPVEQARELGRLVAHAFHNAGGNIESVLSSSDGNLIVGPIATPTSSGAKSQIFILPSPSSSQAPSFPGMSPVATSKPFTPTGTTTKPFTPTAVSPKPFTPTGLAPKVFTPTGATGKPITPTGTPSKTFLYGTGSSKPSTPSNTVSSTFVPSGFPLGAYTPTAVTPGKYPPACASQFVARMVSPQPLPLRPLTPTTATQRTFMPTASHLKLNPSFTKNKPSTSCSDIPLTFPTSSGVTTSCIETKPHTQLTLASGFPHVVSSTTPVNSEKETVTELSPHSVGLQKSTPLPGKVNSYTPDSLHQMPPSPSIELKEPLNPAALKSKSSEGIKSLSKSFSNVLLTKGKGKLLGLVKNEQGQTLPTVPIFLYANMSARMCGVTKVTNCCSKRLQPMYAPQGSNTKISMYSNWRAGRHVQHPLGISWKVHLGMYNSQRNRKSKVLYSQCNFTAGGIYTESKDFKKRKSSRKGKLRGTGKQSRENHRQDGVSQPVQSIESSESNCSKSDRMSQTASTAPNMELSRIPLFPGGYESHEDYVYVRGRGRGKYVCMECGIRCKKPSMLKKHIRTHTDVRPYQCKGCSFSFKTKGNLTKHMKSKAHVKKCLEMGVTPGDINLEDATDDVEEGEEMQFADVDSEDTDSVCSDNSEDGDEMEEDEVEHRETSVFDKSPFGIKSMSQITRVGSCTTSMSAISDSGLSSSLMALHQRMGLRRSLSEVHLASQSEKESKEKDPAREQRLDELMGALKNRTMPPMAKPSRSEVVCKLTQHLTNKQRHSLDGKVPASSMKRSLSVSHLPVASVPVKASPFQPPVSRVTLESPVSSPLYNQSENAVTRTTGSSVPSLLGRSSPLKKSILTRRFEQKEGKEASFRPPLVFPLPVNSHQKEACKSEENSQPMTTTSEQNKLSVSKDTNVTPSKNILLVPPPIIEPISDDEEEWPRVKRQKPHKSESELSKTSHDPTKLSLPGIPEEGNNAIKHLLLTRAPVWPFPLEGLPKSPYSPCFIPPSPSMLNASPSPTLMVPFSPVSGRPPLVSPMSPSKLSQLPATVLSRVHSPSPLARNSLHFRLDPSSKAEMQPPLSDKKESTLGHIESSSAEVLQSDKSLSADDTPHTAATSSSANGEVSPEDEQALPSPSTSGPHRCSTCGKGFMKPNQLRIHCRDHTMEQYYTCFDCCLHFPTKFLLSKHERTEQHFAKVEAVEIATVGSDPEPRPFKCKECSIAFRIPGHLAKHLRSRGHLMTLERSGKLPPHKEQLLRAELGSEDKDDNYAASPESSERTDSASEVEEEGDVKKQ
ncbi:Zinc finger protein 40 [Holothuria leucospilota]|uniref:Zinc finger protein 40 n=1 Tax=Holothuria leucospilota TaxID=206669 RepID=A0A9Q1BDR6_HOLLE|nr:Zinc finger protein 40 [Holothuria leucospilota]